MIGISNDMLHHHMQVGVRVLTTVAVHVADLKTKKKVKLSYYRVAPTNKNKVELRSISQISSLNTTSSCSQPCWICMLAEYWLALLF